MKNREVRAKPIVKLYRQVLRNKVTPRQLGVILDRLTKRQSQGYGRLHGVEASAERYRQTEKALKDPVFARICELLLKNRVPLDIRLNSDRILVLNDDIKELYFAKERILARKMKSKEYAKLAKELGVDVNERSLRYKAAERAALEKSVEKDPVFIKLNQEIEHNHRILNDPVEGSRMLFRGRFEEETENLMSAREDIINKRMKEDDYKKFAGKLGVPLEVLKIKPKK